MALSVVLFASACGAGRVAEVSQPQGAAATTSALPAATHQTPGPSTTNPATVPTDVLFPRQRAGVDYMQASGGGKLVLDEEGCLRIGRRGGAAGDVVVWPHDHSVEVDASGEVRIREGKGRVVAKVGDDVRVGGGEVGDRGIDFVDEGSVPSKQELLERCPGSYYPSANEVSAEERTFGN